jgi:hypothetical protein
MQSDPGWNVELMTIRFAIGVKIAETVDQEWTNQPFVTLRSKGASVIKHPLYLAKVTATTLRNEGVRETARRISRRVKASLRRPPAAVPEGCQLGTEGEQHLVVREESFRRQFRRRWAPIGGAK